MLPLKQPSMEECGALGCLCASCPLDFHPVLGAGNKDARIILVGEKPGRDETRLGRPFVGEAGRLLNELALPYAGLSRKDVYCTNAVMCQPMTANTPQGAITSCNTRLILEIEALPNRHVIVVLGTPAVKALTGRNDGITSLLSHVEWNAQLNCFLVFAVNPAACLKSPDTFQDLLWTLCKAKELLSVPKGQLAPPPVVNYFLFESISCVKTLQEMRQNVSGVVSCDIETKGIEKADALSWQKGEITQIGFFFGDKRAYLFPAPFIHLPAVKQALRDLFASLAIIWLWHNGKFDVQFLKQHLKQPTDVDPLTIPVRIDADTLLLHKCLDERIGGHGLKELVARYIQDYNYGTEKKDFTDPIYHAKDCTYTYMLLEKLHHELREEERKRPSLHGYPGPGHRHDTILAPVMNAIVNIELRGIKLDREYAITLATRLGGYPSEELGGELLVQQQHCQSLSPYKKPIKVRQTVQLPTEWYKAGKQKGQQKPQKTKTVYVDAEQAINLNSAQQIGHLLYGVWKLPILQWTEGGQASVDVETLKALALEAPAHCKTFIEALLAFRKQFKIYRTYVVGAIRESEWDGAIHTHFDFQPVTGRPSSKDLNLQNLPRKSDVRRAYVAREGYTLLEVDYANQEIRAACLYSKDPELLKACVSQDDFHLTVARSAFAPRFAAIDACLSVEDLERYALTQPDFKQMVVAQQQKKKDLSSFRSILYAHLRQAAKKISFGIVYGQGAKGLQDSLASEGINVTLEEAEQYILNYLSKYRKLADWLRMVCKEIIEHEFVDTPRGHRRRKYLVTQQTMGDAKRQAMNSPIQSLSSDATMKSVHQLDVLLIERVYGHILAFVHDSILFEIKLEHVQAAYALIKQVMEHALDDVQSPDFYVPFPVDAKVGPNWRDMEKLV